MSDKVLDRDRLSHLLKTFREKGKTIITTNGSFDLLHVGHVRLLREAKKLADLLVVGVNSDRSVKSYKGPNRPIIGEKERAETVAALACVDYVFIFNEPDPREFLRELKPDLHANSLEYGENCVEAETLKEIGARLVLLPRQADLSTSAIIEALKFEALKSQNKS